MYTYTYMFWGSLGRLSGSWSKIAPGGRSGDLWGHFPAPGRKSLQEVVLELSEASFRLPSKNRSRRSLWGSLELLSGSRSKIAPGSCSGTPWDHFPAPGRKSIQEAVLGLSETTFQQRSRICK